VVALHNFNGSASEFANLIDAERIRQSGVIVVLPQARMTALGREWQGGGVDYFGTANGIGGRPVDDAEFVRSSIAAVREIFSVDSRDISIVGFSQGVSVAYETARRMSAAEPGSVRRVVAAAGTMINRDAVAGVDVIQYEPGYNGLQSVGNLLNWAPSERVFMARLLADKGCVQVSPTVSENGVVARDFVCRDGATVRSIRERLGEHAWPGQPRRYDDWLMGRGSISRVRLTDQLLEAIRSGRVSRDPGRQN
jgi:poly(3-hydroxybutyrate) depolymerase